MEIALSRKHAFKNVNDRFKNALIFCGHTTCVEFECSPDHIFQNGTIYTREGQPDELSTVACLSRLTTGKVHLNR